MGRLLLWVALALLLKHHHGVTHKLVCYFTNWAYSRPDAASILPQDLDPFLCTHLIFAFASMENNQIVAKSALDENILYPGFNKLKERNRKLKTLLSLGGWEFGTRYSAMLSTPTRREKFIDSVISLLRMYNFDGLDLFFLYPGLRGSPTHDRWNFLFLIEELMFAFRKEAINNLHSRLLLSAAVSGIPNIIQTSYDVRFLGRHLDFINILSYDFHGSWETFTGHNSPLFSQPGDPRSSAHAMNYWRNLGAPSEKLIMGVPVYGRTFCLLKASETWLGARATGPASPGKYTKKAGFLAYFEICSFVQKASKHWIEDQFVPYAYKGKKWVGYDDDASFRHKAMFIKKEHFGGAMVWTLDLDDAKGTFCGNGPFPLVHILKNLLVKDGEEAMTTESYGKYENMFTVPSDETVTPGTETVTLGRHDITPKKKTMIPVTVIPGEMTMSPVDNQSVTGEMIMTPLHHLTGTTEVAAVTPVNLQTETTGEVTMTHRRKSVVPEKVTVPLGKMTVTSDGQTKTLRGENLNSEDQQDAGVKVVYYAGLLVWGRVKYEGRKRRKDASGSTYVEDRGVFPWYTSTALLDDKILTLHLWELLECSGILRRGSTIAKNLCSCGLSGSSGLKCKCLRPNNSPEAVQVFLRHSVGSRNLRRNIEYNCGTERNLIPYRDFSWTSSESIDLRDRHLGGLWMLTQSISRTWRRSSLSGSRCTGQVHMNAFPSFVFEDPGFEAVEKPQS